MGRVRVDIGGRAQRAGEHLALGMAGGLLRRQRSPGGEVVGEVVILGELEEVLSTQQVGAAVAHMAEAR